MQRLSSRAALPPTDSVNTQLGFPKIRFDMRLAEPAAHVLSGKLDARPSADETAHVQTQLLAFNIVQVGLDRELFAAADALPHRPRPIDCRRHAN